MIGAWWIGLWYLYTASFIGIKICFLITKWITQWICRLSILLTSRLLTMHLVSLIVNIILIVLHLWVLQNSLKSFWVKMNGAGVMPDTYQKNDWWFYTKNPQVKPKKMACSTSIFLEFKYNASTPLVILKIDFNHYKNFVSKSEGLRMSLLQMHK